MKCFVSLILSTLITCAFSNISAQQYPVISKPELSLEESTLVISFDIGNSNQTEKYNIHIEVKDSQGKELKPRTVSGDIGENISGGSDKVIRWDLNADQVSMDLVLDVVIVGSRIPSEGLSGSDVQVTRWGAVGRSVVFPGWGLSKVHPGEPHWIKGVAGYGCIAGTLILNQSAHVNYQNYLDANDPLEREEFYNKSLAQEQISTVMAYTAIGIFVADVIWTLVGTRDLSKKSASAERKGLSIGTDYETLGNTPMLAIRYTF